MSNVVRYALAGCAVLLAGCGSVQVTLEPQAAVTAGAQWRIDGGAWRDSAATAVFVFVGRHAVDYKGVPICYYR